jgi:DNA polymerase III epsilon subunit-like protein
MDAKRAALPDDAVQQHRRALRDAVFLGEKFLELVNHQQRARHRLGAARPLVTGHVLRAEFAEQIAAPAQFLIHPLQHAQAEFAVALDGDHFRVRHGGSRSI